MSLRSNSPCTSTSMSISSCQRTARLGLAGAGTPGSRRRSARPWRGRRAPCARPRSAGTSRSSWSGTAAGSSAGAAARDAASNAPRRRVIDGVTAATRIWTAASWMRGRDRTRGRRHGGGVRARPSTASRPSFSASAERRQLLDLLHGEGQPAADLGIHARLPARGRPAHAAASRTARGSAGRRRAAGRSARSRSSSASRSARQTLRPSITPSDSTSSFGAAGEHGRRAARARAPDRHAGRRPAASGGTTDCRRARRNRWSASASGRDVARAEVA